MSAIPTPSPQPSSRGCCSADAGAEALPVELGLGPLLRFCALWSAAAILLATELPFAGRIAAAALVLRALPAWGRGCWGDGRCGGDRGARLLPPRGDGRQWRLAAAGRWQELRLDAAGTLPGCGWLLRFDAGPGATWVWVDARRLDRAGGRRLRAAITAGRT